MSTKQSSSGKKVSKKDTKSEQPASVAATVTAAVSAPVSAQPPSDSKSTKKAPAKPVAKAAAPVAAPVPAKSAVAKPAAAKSAAPAKKAVSVKKADAPKKAASTKKSGGAKKEAKKATPKVDQATEGDEDSRTRYFKVIVDGGEAHGRFSGSKPKQAANKALTSILKTKEQTGGGVAGEIKFSIVECTRGSKHKQYNYIGQRVKLDKPMEVTIGSGPNAKKIEYRFNNRVMKDKEAVVQA